MTSQYLVVKYLGSVLPDNNVLRTITFFIRKQDGYQESLAILFLDKNTMKDRHRFAHETIDSVEWETIHFRCILFMTKSTNLNFKWITEAATAGVL